jgi:hypothetical protein
VLLNWALSFRLAVLQIAKKTKSRFFFDYWASYPALSSRVVMLDNGLPPGHIGTTWENVGVL